MSFTLYFQTWISEIVLGERMKTSIELANFAVLHIIFDEVTNKRDKLFLIYLY